MSVAGILISALFWYLSIGALLALTYNYCDRESGPMRRTQAILFALVLWLPAIIAAAIDSRKNPPVTKK